MRFGLYPAAVLFSTAALTWSAPATAQTAPATRSERPPPPARTGAQVAKKPSCIDTLLADGGFDANAPALIAGLRDAATTADPAKPGDLRDVALGARLAEQLAKVPPAIRTDLTASLRERRAAATQLAFLIDPARDDAGAAWTLFDRLRRERGAKAERLAGLTAALCVVRDRPLERRVNENTPTPADPVAVFDYFERNEQRMLFSLRDTPPELLVYVADVTAGPEELDWALGRYAKSGDIGAKFFDIQYDMEHYGRGAPKQVTTQGFTLPNIFRYGGVCADQAYFAATVGKAIGAPSAYVVGNSAEVGHAWVGFLDGNPRNARWNFDAGRYDEFKNNKGWVVNAQTGERMADSELGMLAELLRVKDEDRHNAVALADCASVLAGRLGPGAGGAKGDPGAAPEVGPALAMLRAALRENPACVPAWSLFTRLAAEDRLSIEHKREWAEAVRRLCAGQYPDFALDVLTPMVETIDDPKEQGRIWNALFMDFGKRADLGARVRLAEARMWEKHADTAKALGAYREVIDRYANVGPSAVSALAAAGQLLFKENKQSQALALMDATWRKLPRPGGASMFAASSNWSRTGMVYAAALADAGRLEDSTRVMAELGLK